MDAVLSDSIEAAFGDAPELVLFNPYLKEVHDDPYPLYHRLRAEDAVHRTQFGAWLITRYDHAVAILRDPRFSVDPTNRKRPEGFDVLGGLEPEERGMSSVMLFIDPPDHTRLRTLVNKAFTPRVVESLRPRIREVVEVLLDDAQERGSMDVIADLAYPLPVIVISELLGIPLEDRTQIREWSSDIAPILDPMISPETARRIESADIELADYFIRLIEDRRRAPRDDLLSNLIKAEEEGDVLSPQELMSTCILLLIAGHETTMNLIGNGLLALLRHRDQLERLRMQPSLTKTAVEECLRYDGPVHLTGRIALEEVYVGGHSISRGDMCVLLLGAADRDPEQFPEPDRLDVARSPNRHVAFSAGPHFCLGATLARTEAQIAFDAVVNRMPRIELAGDAPTFRETITLRGLKALPVTF